MCPGKDEMSGPMINGLSFCLYENSRFCRRYMVVCHRGRISGCFAEIDGLMDFLCVVVLN